MKRITAMLRAAWFVTLIGALALSVVIWFIGPLVAVADVRPLAGGLARGAVVLLIILAWGLYNLLARARAARTDKAMVSTIAAAEGGAIGDASEEIAQLRQRLAEALLLLKKSAGSQAGRGRYLYQLPWYILIGPPGAGKTTALQNSGLNFPLARRYGKDPVRGVGGTRDCDWWFTDEAVLLDTAGRYTTQDSHQALDQAAWRGFLGLLRKFRPRQPINGALVAISIADIAGLPASERLAHARAIRQRLQELQAEFNLRFPVYLLLTKADLIAGFVEYFDDLGRDEREQVWGVTLPLDAGAGADAAALARFPAEFDALIERLNQRLLTRLQQETDLGKRGQVWGFPAQVALLKGPIVEFLDEAFAPNRYEAGTLLRGVYLTSGTQEGTPVDRVMSAMVAAFGIDRQRLTAFSGAGRSYFLTRVLRQVVFAEASMVGANPALERRRVWLRRGAYAAAAAGLVACLGAWTTSYFANRALFAAVDAQLSLYRKQVAPFAKPVVADDDLPAILPALQSLRDIPAGYEAQGRGVPLAETFGLYQGDKLGAAALPAYRRALVTLFRPRLLILLGQQIRSHLDQPEYVQEILKAYLMLGGSAPRVDTAFLHQALAYDWDATYPGPAQAATRQALSAHLDALLEAPLEPMALDGQVIAQARTVLLATPLAGRAYALIRQSEAARALPEWRIVDHAGPAADRVFVRQGGSLASGVPGLYTYAGFHKVFLPEVGKVAATLAGESWVLGPAAPPTDARKLQSDVTALYLGDYAAQWDRLLAEVTIVPFHGMTEAAAVLNILAGPTSPLKTFYSSVAGETDLTRPDAGAGSALAAAAQGATGQAAAAAGAAPAPLKALVAGVLPGAQPPPGQSVDDHFKWLRDYVGLGGKGPAPIDQTIASLNDAYLQINGLAQAGPGAPGQRLGGGALDALKTVATRVPPRVGAILDQIRSNAVKLTTGSLRDQLREAWSSKVLPFCEAALGGRYPIVRTSPNDATLDDFTRLFAPNGLIDGFFAADLKPYVDLSGAPWRWQSVGGVDLGFAPQALTGFERAAAIRDAFFPAGSAKPALNLELIPVTLDPKSTQVLIDVDGQQASYAHGPPQPAPLRWPGAGVAGGRIVFSPADKDQPSSLSVAGPWALFRLFDAGTVERGGLADRMRVTFTLGPHKAVYDVRASSVLNPLAMKELGEFRCPHL